MPEKIAVHAWQSWFQNTKPGTRIEKSTKNVWLKQGKLIQKTQINDCKRQRNDWKTQCLNNQKTNIESKDTQLTLKDEELNHSTRKQKSCKQHRTKVENIQRRPNWCNSRNKWHASAIWSVICDRIVLLFNCCCFCYCGCCNSLFV